MKRTYLTAVAAACIWSGVAGAMPPPISIPVVVISRDSDAQAIGEAFVTILHERGWFSRPATALQRGQFYECIRDAPEPETCIRGYDSWKGGGAKVVVLVSGTAQQDWKCIGIASGPKYADRQLVKVDVQKGMFASAEQQKEERDKAGGCIIAAGAESGW